MTDLKIIYLPYNFFAWAVSRGLLPETAIVVWEQYKDVVIPEEQVKLVLPLTGDSALHLGHLATLTAIYQGSLQKMPAMDITKHAQQYVMDFSQTLVGGHVDIFDEVVDSTLTGFDYETFGAPKYLVNVFHPVTLGLAFLSQKGLLPDGRVMAYIGDDSTVVPQDYISDINDWVIDGKDIEAHRTVFLEHAEKRFSKECLELLKVFI